MEKNIPKAWGSGPIILNGVEIEKIERNGEKVNITLKNGQSVEVNKVDKVEIEEN